MPPGGIPLTAVLILKFEPNRKKENYLVFGGQYFICIRG